MILPRPRFVAAAGLSLCLGLALPYSLGQSLAPWFGLVAALMLVAAVDLLLAQRLLSSLGPVASSAPRLSCCRQRDFALELVLAKRPGQSVMLRCAVELPPSIDCADAVLELTLPAAAEAVQLKWNLLPRQRGLYRFPRLHVGLISRLGLWECRRSLDCHFELQVQPDPREEEKAWTALFLRNQRLGQHARRFPGQGREFDHLREYTPGDSAADIHWKASARRGWPVTKIHQAERSREIIVCLDCSRLSGRSVPGRPGSRRLDLYVNATLIIAAMARAQGDRFGFIAFSDRIRCFLPAASGAVQQQALLDSLSRLESQELSPDYGELAADLCGRLRKRALVFILADLDDPVVAEDFVHAAGLISLHHLIVASTLSGDGCEEIFRSPLSPASLPSALAAHERYLALRGAEASLRGRGVRFGAYRQADFALQLVSRYAEIKERQQQ